MMHMEFVYFTAVAIALYILADRILLLDRNVRSAEPWSSARWCSSCIAPGHGAGELLADTDAFRSGVIHNTI